jgi:hypothetical protein
LPETRESRWENRDFPSPKSDFLRSNLIFFNGFPISEKSKKIFFNGFPISSTAFYFPRNPGKIYLRRQIYERLLSELRISRSKLQY